MTSVAEIKQAIPDLTEAEYAELSRWMTDRSREQWEREFDEDVAAGRLDALASEALDAKAKGELKAL